MAAGSHSLAILRPPAFPQRPPQSKISIQHPTPWLLTVVHHQRVSKNKESELKMNSLKATKYTGMVRQLPSVTDINEADEETLAGYRAQLTEASKYYEDMTDAQKQLVADDTRTRFNTAEAAVTNAEKKFEKPDDTEESKDPVADLLQQILDQLAGNKKEETENNPDNSNQDSGQGTPETGAAE